MSPPREKSQSHHQVVGTFPALSLLKMEGVRIILDSDTTAFVGNKSEIIGFSQICKLFGVLIILADLNSYSKFPSL